MEIGLCTEFHCPAGMDETRAFDESLAQMTAAAPLSYRLIT